MTWTWTGGRASIALAVVSLVTSSSACSSGSSERGSSASNTTGIRICPATCERVQDATDAKVDILFGCDTIPVG